MVGYANRNSGQVESLMFVGSTPTPTTDGVVVKGNDARLARGKSGFDSPQLH
jgi:hypothetical protein